MSGKGGACQNLTNPARPLLCTPTSAERPPSATRFPDMAIHLLNLVAGRVVRLFVLGRDSHVVYVLALPSSIIYGLPASLSVSLPIFTIPSRYPTTTPLELIKPRRTGASLTPSTYTNTPTHTPLHNLIQHLTCTYIYPPSQPTYKANASVADYQDFQPNKQTSSTWISFEINSGVSVDGSVPSLPQLPMLMPLPPSRRPSANLSF